MAVKMRSNVLALDDCVHNFIEPYKNWQLNSRECAELKFFVI